MNKSIIYRNRWLFLCTFFLTLSACNQLIQRKPLDISLKNVFADKTTVLSTSEAKLHLIVFFSPTCPICRSILNEIKETSKVFSNQGVAVSVVIPPKYLSDTTLLRQQFSDNDQTISFYVDLDFKLAKQLKAQITPEVFILDSLGNIFYQGAFNDYYRSIGAHKTQVDRHYVSEALTAAIGNQPYTPRVTTAVGCYLEY
jgi:thioredoxin-related protein